MSIHHNILGKPGRDNVLYLKIDSGQSNTNLLFDCGDDCLNELSIKDIQNIDLTSSHGSYCRV